MKFKFGDPVTVTTDPLREAVFVGYDRVDRRRAFVCQDANNGEGWKYSEFLKNIEPKKRKK